MGVGSKYKRRVRTWVYMEIWVLAIGFMGLLRLVFIKYYFNGNIFYSLHSGRRFMAHLAMGEKLPRQGWLHHLRRWQSILYALQDRHETVWKSHAETENTL